MTDFQILCFLQAAAHQNFTKAAEALGITQPALSREIAALERGLGLILFKRTKSGALLTSEGSIMYAAFQESSQRIQAGLEKAVTIRDRTHNLVTIGCPQDWRIDVFMNEMVNQFKKADPHIQIEILQLGSNDLYDSLDDGSLDLVFDCSQPDLTGEDFIIREIRKARTYLMYPEPMRPTQLIEDFVESTFILLSQDPDIRELSKSIQTWTGYPPLNTITVNSAEAQFLSVRCGLGVAVINEMSRNIDQKEVRYLKLRETVPILAISKFNASKSYVHKILQALESAPA